MSEPEEGKKTLNLPAVGELWALAAKEILELLLAYLVPVAGALQVREVRISKDW